MKEDVTPKSHGTMMTAAINLIPRIPDSYSFCCYSVDSSEKICVGHTDSVSLTLISDKFFPWCRLQWTPPM